MNNPLRPLNEKEIERFWKYVSVLSDNQCWEWQGTTDGEYGKLHLKRDPLVSLYKNPSNKMDVKAHRISYFLAFGVDAKEMDVCHHCDNPLCCNPKHLFIGTRQENLMDMVRKGRRTWVGMKGEDNPLNKLSDKQVIAIRKKYASGYSTQRGLAIEYGVARSLVGRITKGTVWRHLPCFEKTFTSRKGMRPQAL